MLSSINYSILYNRSLIISSSPFLLLVSFLNKNPSKNLPKIPNRNSIIKIKYPHYPMKDALIISVILIPLYSTLILKELTIYQSKIYKIILTIKGVNVVLLTHPETGSKKNLLNSIIKTYSILIKNSIKSIYINLIISLILTDLVSQYAKKTLNQLKLNSSYLNSKHSYNQQTETVHYNLAITITPCLKCQSKDLLKEI